MCETHWPIESDQTKEKIKCAKIHSQRANIKIMYDSCVECYCHGVDNEIISGLVALYFS